jgi:hypothetical protein
VPSTYGNGLWWNFFCKVSVNKTASLALLISYKVSERVPEYAKSVTHRDTEVDGGSSGSIVGVVDGRGSRSGNVNDRSDLVLLEDLSELSLVLDRDQDLLNVQVLLSVNVALDLGS